MTAKKTRSYPVSCLNRLEEKVDILSELITGNGHPEMGVIIKLDRLIKAQEIHYTEAQEEREEMIRKISRRDNWLIAIGAPIAIAVILLSVKILFFGLVQMQDVKGAEIAPSTVVINPLNFN